MRILESVLSRWRTKPEPPQNHTGTSAVPEASHPLKGGEVRELVGRLLVIRERLRRRYGLAPRKVR